MGIKMRVDFRRYALGDEKEIASIHNSDFKERWDGYHLSEERIQKLSDGIIVCLKRNHIVAYALLDMNASLERAEMEEIHVVKEFITLEVAISLVREVMRLAREYNKRFLCFRMDTDFIPELRMVFPYLPGGCTLIGGALIMLRNLKEPIPDYKPPSGIHIREYRPGDEVKIEEVERAGLPGYVMTAEEVLERVRSLDFHSGEIQVAVENDRIVGVCNAFPIIGKGQRCLGIVVHPKYQRKGIGKALMSNILKFAQSLGESHIILETGLTSRGIKLYEQMGFITVKTYNGAKVTVDVKKEFPWQLSMH